MSNFQLLHSVGISESNVLIMKGMNLILRIWPSAGVQIGLTKKMHQGCDRFYDMTEMHEAYSYTYDVNGQSFMIRF
jgi:hypothetical protein